MPTKPVMDGEATADGVVAVSWKISPALEAFSVTGSIALPSGKGSFTIEATMRTVGVTSGVAVKVGKAARLRGDRPRSSTAPRAFS